MKKNVCKKRPVCVYGPVCRKIVWKGVCVSIYTRVSNYVQKSAFLPQKNWQWLGCSRRVVVWDQVACEASLCVFCWCQFSVKMSMVRWGLTCWTTPCLMLDIARIYGRGDVLTHKRAAPWTGPIPAFSRMRVGTLRSEIRSFNVSYEFRERKQTTEVPKWPTAWKPRSFKILGPYSLYRCAEMDVVSGVGKPRVVQMSHSLRAT